MLYATLGLLLASRSQKSRSHYVLALFLHQLWPYDDAYLQAGVARLFNEIGLSARIEEKLKTPRGEVKIDVFAADEASVDKISYLVECKNRNSAIPQAVFHAFTTVMAETGLGMRRQRGRNARLP